MNQIEIMWCESFDCFLLSIWLHLCGGPSGVGAQEGSARDEAAGLGERRGQTKLGLAPTVAWRLIFFMKNTLVPVE
jgi:hypothetical protein